MPFNPDEPFDTPNPTYYWYRIGEADGQQQHPRRTVDPLYQDNYDEGWRNGMYFATQLDRITL